MTIIGVEPFQLQNGTTADATQVMANLNKIVGDVNANAAGNGVNSDITSLTALIVPITPTQGGSTIYTAGASTGTANAQVIAAPTPVGFTKTTGRRITFLAGFTNTGPTTLNVNSTGVAALLKPSPAGPIALTGGEVVFANYIEADFDGTQFVLYTNAATQGYGPLTALASAATTDLGTIPSHNVQITGVAAITAFGSTAVATYPVYKIAFSGSLTLTHNAVSLILPGAANIITAANDTAEAFYLGSGNWQVINYSRASGTAVISGTPISGAQGLVIANNAGTPNTNIDITADQAVLINATGAVPLYAQAVSLTINTTTTGANGLDTGARASSTWYNLFIISDGNTVAGLASLSATAPTLPGAFAFKVRVGAMRTDGSGNFLRSRQAGNKVTNLTSAANLPTITTNGAIGGTYTNFSISTFAPPTAVSIFLNTFAGSNGVGPSFLGVAGFQAGTAPQTQPLPEWEFEVNGAQVLIAAGTPEIYLQSTNIFIASSALTNCFVGAAGWRDKVNAT